MLITTSDYIPGRNIETLGLVEGCMALSKNAVKDIGAGLKSLVGGELVSYTKMIDEAKSQAKERATQQAQRWQADAIIGFRYSTTSMADGATAVVAYGTAVRFI